MTFEQAFSKIKEKFGSVDKKKLDEEGLFARKKHNSASKPGAAVL